MDIIETRELLNMMTASQKKLFLKNLKLWKKTVSLNGRTQHFDSFEIDRNDLMNAWKSFLNNILLIEFE